MEQNKNEIDNQDLFLYNNFTNLHLASINLADCKISQIDSYKMLANNFKQMIELDLEGNLISTWDEILSILNGLNTIKIINVRFD